MNPASQPRPASICSPWRGSIHGCVLVINQHVSCISVTNASLVVKMQLHLWNSTIVPPVRSFPSSQCALHPMEPWPCRTSHKSFHTCLLGLVSVPIFNFWYTPTLWSSNTTEVREILICNARDHLIGQFLQCSQSLPPVVGIHGHQPFLHHLVQESSKRGGKNHDLSPQINPGGNPCHGK
jgi:hypothetical protein